MTTPKRPAAIINADMRLKTWRSKDGKHAGHFRPNGSAIFVGDESVFRRNPETWDNNAEDTPTLSARIFVGFNVGHVPTYNVDQLIEIVQAVRREQGHKPDSSFIAQKGLYTSKRDGSLVTEDGAQVVIINLAGDDMTTFRNEMMVLAETIAGQMQQEEVILEMQRDGMTTRTSGVRP